MPQNPFDALEFCLNVFTEFSDKNYLSLKGSNLPSLV